MATSIPPITSFSAQIPTRKPAPPKDNKIMFGENNSKEVEEEGGVDELSDEQIATLLQEASTRLQQKVFSSGKAAAADIEELDPNSIRFPKLNPGPLPESYIQTNKGGVSRITTTAGASVIIASAPLSITDPVPVVKRKDPNSEAATAGKQWFDLPLTSKDPQTLRDIQLIQMREALDPHRHYKKNILKTVPKYSQMGTIIADHSEFYSARLTNKERKKTILEEVMSSKETLDRFKRKRNELQEKSRSGGREHYKRLKERRKRK